MPIKYVKPGSMSHFSALCIGRAGIGKTSLLKTIPDDEPVLVLSAESGLLCVRDLVDSGRIAVVDIESVADMQDVMSALKDKGWQDAYKWVFIDSLTEIADKYAAYSQKKIPDKKDTFAMWHFYSQTMTDLVKDLRDMPHYNIVITCLEKIKTNEVNQRFITADVPGPSFAAKLVAVFDEVLYMTLGEDHEGKECRVLYTQPGQTTPGKDRSGALDQTEMPDLAVIRNKILSVSVGG